MLRFIVRRLLVLIPILICVSILVFLVLRLARGDPAMAYLRMSNIPPTEQALAEARRELGLDRPIAEQYAAWAARAVRLDFGRSYVTGKPVLQEVLYYLPATLTLAGWGLLFTLLVSVPLGVAAALHKDQLADHLTRALAFVGVSMPSFWLGYLLLYLFSVKLGWLPPMGRGGAAHLVMPVVTLSAMSIAVNIRFLRAAGGVGARHEELPDPHRHRHGHAPGGDAGRGRHRGEHLRLAGTGALRGPVGPEPGLPRAPVLHPPDDRDLRRLQPLR